MKRREGKGDEDARKKVFEVNKTLTFREDVKEIGPRESCYGEIRGFCRLKMHA